MTGIILTPHQQAALDWVVARLREGQGLVALRGLAGTGKTTLIPALRAALEALGIPVVVGSPTHRAAMILRRKGIKDADTVHAHALTPYFLADYVEAAAWLGEDLPCRWRDDDVPKPRVESLPWLLYQRVQPNLDKAKRLRRYGGSVKATRLLASVGIQGKDFFDGFGPKAGLGVLIIDEASMVGSTLLSICEEAFPQIVLIGDPGQLPPVKDVAMLHTIDGIDLVEIHRQAADSPIIQLAYQARNGEPFWAHALPLAEEVTSTPLVAASAFLDSPLIVWRNITRITCTHDIRHALGYTKEHLTVGEPLVCRSTSQEDRAVGFYNNGLYRIVELDTDDPRHVTVEDALGNQETVYAHLEELDGDEIPHKAIPFRFGYCLTAHTAQGGEWPTVYISMPDLRRFAGMCAKQDRQAELAQWAYTAITRAKHTLCFLTHHAFERASMATTPVAPPSAPMLTTLPAASAPLPADDIADPVVPAEVTAALTPPPLPDGFGAHEALLQGFCQHLQRRVTETMLATMKSVGTDLDNMYADVKGWVEKNSKQNEHSLYQFSDALLKLQEQGLALRHDPYTASVQAVSPQGYPLTLHIAKSDVGALITALPELCAWLADNAYKPVAYP